MIRLGQSRLSTITSIMSSSYISTFSFCLLFMSSVPSCSLSSSMTVHSLFFPMLFIFFPTLLLVSDLCFFSFSPLLFSPSSTKLALGYSCLFPLKAGLLFFKESLYFLVFQRGQELNFPLYIVVRPYQSSMCFIGLPFFPLLHGPWPVPTLLRF